MTILTCLAFFALVLTAFALAIQLQAARKAEAQLRLDLAAAVLRTNEVQARAAAMVDLDVVTDRRLIEILDGRFDGMVLAGLKVTRIAPKSEGRVKLEHTTMTAYEIPTDPETSTYMCRMLWEYHNAYHGGKKE